MKRVALLVCLFVFSLCAVHARADVDPQIGLGDPTCQPGDVSLASTGGFFNFTNNSSGGGFFTFCNDTGSTISSVDVKFFNTPGYSESNPITCISNVFVCDISYNTAFVDLSFTLGSFFAASLDEEAECEPTAGIGVNCQMTVNLNNEIGEGESAHQCDPRFDTGCTGDWPTNPPITFFGRVNDEVTLPVPEPASLLLLGSGFVALWRFRNRR